MGFVNYNDKTKYQDVKVFTSVQHFWMYHLLAFTKNVLHTEIIERGIAVRGLIHSERLTDDDFRPIETLKNLHKNGLLCLFGESSYGCPDIINYTIDPNRLVTKPELLYLHGTQDVLKSVGEFMRSSKMSIGLYYTLEAILISRSEKVQLEPPIYETLKVRYPTTNLEGGLAFTIAEIIMRIENTTVNNLYMNVAGLYNNLIRGDMGIFYKGLEETLTEISFKENLGYLESCQVIKINRKVKDHEITFLRRLPVETEPSSYNMLVLAMAFGRYDYIEEVYREPENATPDEISAYYTAIKFKNEPFFKRIMGRSSADDVNSHMVNLGLPYQHSIF